MAIYHYKYDPQLPRLTKDANTVIGSNMLEHWKKHHQPRPPPIQILCDGALEEYLVYSNKSVDPCNVISICIPAAM